MSENLKITCENMKTGSLAKMQCLEVKTQIMIVLEMNQHLKLFLNQTYKAVKELLFLLCRYSPTMQINLSLNVT